MFRNLSSDKLHEKQEKIQPFLAGFDQLSDHVIITDKDGHILYANAAARKATGYKGYEMLGKNPGDLWGGHMEKDFYRNMWKRIKKEKKPFIGEVKNMSKDGKERIQELRISPVLDEKGGAAFFIGIEPDVSGRVKDKEFREELLSIVGNDSLAPATAVKWALEGLLQARALTDEQKKALHEAAKQNERLIAQIRDLIVLSAAKGHPLRTKIDLVSMLRQIIGNIKEDYPDVAVTFDPSLKTAAVSSHEKLLEKMLSVPIVYAASASAHGGTVDVQLQKDGDGFVVRCRCGQRVQKREALLRHALVALIASYLHYDAPVMTVRGGTEECNVRIPKTI
ncbi:MAG TPA: PAS domain S-box protein [Candidatus Peribacteraceae bacterium]|nr:PAS domain S-box protein [Candidatus Peribacteraceae bacterium]